MDEPTKRTLLCLLKEMGVAEATIEFNGQGDEGQIGAIVAKGLVEEIGKIPVAPVDGHLFRPTMGYTFGENGEQIYNYGSPPKTLYELLENVGYALLDDTDVDWINNDGGYGDITIVPSEDDIIVNMNVRFTSSEYSRHNYGFKPDEDGEVTPEGNPGDDADYDDADYDDADYDDDGNLRAGVDHNKISFASAAPADRSKGAS